MVEGCIGTIIIGGMNVHHKSWLTFSNGTSIAGRALHDVCFRLGLQQCVHRPTRGKYLLDLVLTDLDSILKTTILPMVADHNAVLSTIRANVLQSVAKKRKVWEYDAANWDGMEAQIESMDWRTTFHSMELDGIVEHFTKFLLRLVEEYVPTKWIKITSDSHPWLSNKSWSAIKEKRKAEGTEQFVAKQRECSKQIHEDYWDYVKAMKK